MAGAGAGRRIVVDRTLCIGSGNCTFYASQTFDLDDEDKAVVIAQDGDDAVSRGMAVDNCPTGALSFEPDG